MKLSGFVIIYCAALCAGSSQQQQTASSTATAAAGWPMYNGSYQGDRWSDLAAITKYR